MNNPKLQPDVEPLPDIDTEPIEPITEEELQILRDLQAVLTKRIKQISDNDADLPPCGPPPPSLW